MNLLDAFQVRSSPRARAFATLAMGLSLAAGSLVAVTASRAQFHLAPVTADAPNREAAQVEISATGEHIYVLGSLSNDFTLSRGPILHLYSREPESGSVRYRTSYEPRTPGFEDLRVKAIDSSPDGRHLYLANSDPEQPELDGLWILALRPTGEIELLDKLPARDSGLSGADRVLATPDGSHVIAAGRTLLVFERDPETGGLTQIQELPRPEARHLVLTADGRYLAATGFEPALRVYRRDIGTGFLSPAMELQDSTSTDSPTSGSSSSRQPRGPGWWPSSENSDSSSTLNRWWSSLSRIPQSGSEPIPGESPPPAAASSRSPLTHPMARPRPCIGTTTEIASPS